jgi:hypothetical protein
MFTRSAVLLAMTLGVFGSSANASTLIYNDTTKPGTAPGSLTNYPFDVLTSFKVDASGLYVFGLGVYDSPLTATIPVGSTLEVGLYNDTTNSVAIAFTSMVGATLVAGSDFATKAITPVALISGDTYSLESVGYGQTVSGKLYDTGLGLQTLTTFNTLGGDLTNVTGGNNGSATKGQTASNVNATTSLVNGLCELTNGCTAASGNNRYNGGTDYAADQTALIGTPLPAALWLFGSGLGVMGVFGSRGKRRNARAIAAV